MESPDQILFASTIMSEYGKNIDTFSPDFAKNFHGEQKNQNSCKMLQAKGPYEVRAKMRKMSTLLWAMQLQGNSNSAPES